MMHGEKLRLAARLAIAVFLDAMQCLKMRVATSLALAVFLTAENAREVIRIRIDNLTFLPPLASAHVGDTVEWVKVDFVAHTATEANGEWDVMIPATTTRRLLLKDAGRSATTADFVQA